MARFFPVGEAITRGEQKVLDYLQHALPDNWVVFGNAQFTTSELPCDVDTIVVGDRCIWVVDAKGFGARLRGDEHTWILADGSAPERILNNVLHAAKMVSGRPALWEQAKRCRSG
jgi:Nuclease-related domain